MKYGPVVLACSGTPKNLSQVLPMDGDITTLLVRRAGSLVFIDNDQHVLLKPYYEYKKGERYILYISAK